ncbi:hypothetical protein ACF0H5_004893 [Mactra antiquata]
MAAKPKLEQEEVILLPQHFKNKQDSRLKIGKFYQTTDKASEKRPIRTKRVTHEQFVLPKRRENESGNSELPHRPIKLDQSGHKQGNKLQNVVQPMMSPSWQHQTTDANNTLKRLPNVNKISHPNQTKDDFYSYTTHEIVECFKFCGLDVMAKLCYEHRLDGAFFQGLSAADLQKYFNLNSTEIKQVNQMIYEGWRPKLIFYR